MEVNDLSAVNVNESGPAGRASETERNTAYINSSAAESTTTIASEEGESVYIPSQAVNDTSSDQEANLEQYNHNRYIAKDAFIYGNRRLDTAALTAANETTTAVLPDQDESTAEEVEVALPQGRTETAAAETVLPGQDESTAEEVEVALPQPAATAPETSAAAPAAASTAQNLTSPRSDADAEALTAAPTETSAAADTAGEEADIYAQATIYSQGPNVMNQATNAYGDNVRTTVGSSVGTEQDPRSTTDSAVATAAAEDATAAATTLTAEEVAEQEAAEQGTAHNDTGPNGEELTNAEQQRVDELEAREDEVIAHEQAHIAAGNGLTGSASYGYTTGPDGKQYINEGEVSIDISEEDNPEDTITKMSTVRSAALAPAEPSAQDRQVASEAARIQAEARRELAAAEDEADGEGVDAGTTDTTGSQFDSLSSGPASSSRSQALG